MEKEKIYDANDKAIDEGFEDAMDRLNNLHKRSLRSKGEYSTWAWEGLTTDKDPVTAFVERGRWLAMCECGSAEWVADGVPFFCRNCGNSEYKGKARNVIFPDGRAELEKELLNRIVHARGGRKPTERTLSSIPDNKMLGREWRHGETVEDLVEQKNKVQKELRGE